MYQNYQNELILAHYDHSNELMHYGVKGMHWGIRRYQPYPDGSINGKFVGRKSMARQAKRVLNKNDKLNAHATYYKAVSEGRANKFMAKAQKVRNPIKKAKLQNKASGEMADAKIWAQRINEGKRATQDTIRAMGKAGFATQKTYTVREVERGKNIAISVLAFLGAGIAGAAAGSSVMVGGRYSKIVDGTRYKVKDTQGMSQRQIQKIGKKNAKWARLTKASDRDGSSANAAATLNKKETKLMNSPDKKKFSTYAITDHGNGKTTMAVPSKKPGPVAMLTAAEAKKLGLDASTRVTGKEEEQFWKDLAKEYEKKKR